MAKAKKKKVRIMKSLWGKFSLPYVVGTDVMMDAKVATELMKEGFVIPSEEGKKFDQDAQAEKAADQSAAK